MADCVTSLWAASSSSSTRGGSTTPTPALRSARGAPRACRRWRSASARWTVSGICTTPVPFSFDLPASGRLLGQAADRLPPHLPDPPHLRASRRPARGPAGGPGGRRGRATRRRPTCRPRFASAAWSCSPTPTISSRSSYGGPRPRRDRRHCRLQMRTVPRARHRDRRRARSRRATDLADRPDGRQRVDRGRRPGGRLGLLDAVLADERVGRELIGHDRWQRVVVFCKDFNREQRERGPRLPCVQPMAGHARRADRPTCRALARSRRTWWCGHPVRWWAFIGLWTADRPRRLRRGADRFLPPRPGCWSRRVPGRNAGSSPPVSPDNRKRRPPPAAVGRAQKIKYFAKFLVGK